VYLLRLRCLYAAASFLSSRARTSPTTVFLLSSRKSGGNCAALPYPKRGIPCRGPHPGSCSSSIGSGRLSYIRALQPPCRTKCPGRRTAQVKRSFLIEAIQERAVPPLISRQTSWFRLKLVIYRCGRGWGRFHSRLCLAARDLVFYWAIIGSRTGRIFHEIKTRPIYFVSEASQFSMATASSSSRQNGRRMRAPAPI
jgi:hypothetical protein